MNKRWLFKTALHTVGLSWLVANTVLMVIVFYYYYTQGSVRLYEDVLFIRYVETGLLVYALVYGVYLLWSFVSKSYKEYMEITK